MRVGFVLLVFVSSLVNANEDLNKCDGADHKAFDFWLGRWKVTENGKLAGTNHIQKIQGGCAIQETWVSATSNFTGTSYNFFNSESGQWQQLWLDNQGKNLQFSGNLIGSQMVLKTHQSVDGNGMPVVNQITWSLNEDGTVNQRWQLLSNGRVEKTLFNGLYQRVEPK